MANSDSLPRIFISHSAGGAGAGDDFLDALVRALRHEDYPVVVDRDDLQLGTTWRSTINVWVGGCDVAIVLLSRAALDSPFVAYETSILTYRRRFDGGFLLIPVYLEGGRRRQGRQTQPDRAASPRAGLQHVGRAARGGEHPPELAWLRTAPAPQVRPASAAPP